MFAYCLCPFFTLPTDVLHVSRRHPAGSLPATFPSYFFAHDFQKNISVCWAECKITVRTRTWYKLALKMSFAKCILANLSALMHFVFIILKNVLPAPAGNTFLKTNSEQPAFKFLLFGALKASNDHLLGHLFGTYGSQSFLFAAFPLQSPIRVLKDRRQNA